MGKFVLLVFALFLLSGCGATGQAPAEQAAPVPVTVDFKVMPAEPKAGDQVTLQVQVKQGNELVDDASDVEFEIWKEGQKDHDMITAVKKSAGIYSQVKKFTESGSYNVMYHVTARNMHTMAQADNPIKVTAP